MTGTLLKLGIQKFFGEVPFLILGEIGYIYIYIGPTQSWPKYFCVTEMTYLVEFLRTRIIPGPQYDQRSRHVWSLL